MDNHTANEAVLPEVDTKLYSKCTMRSTSSSFRKLRPSVKPKGTSFASSQTNFNYSSHFLFSDHDSTQLQLWKASQEIPKKHKSFVVESDITKAKMAFK